MISFFDISLIAKSLSLKVPRNLIDTKSLLLLSFIFLNTSVEKNNGY
jgi:hypothetical protein